MLKQNFGILVAIPVCGRPTQSEWGIALACMHYPTGCNHTLGVIKGKPIDEARNEFINIAIRYQIPYVFFLDDDVRPWPDALIKLHKVIASDPSIIAVAGIYPPKRHPIEPMVYRKIGKGPSYDWKYDDVFQVEALATGLMMVSVEAVKTLPKPWFKTLRNEPDEHGHVYSITDDIYFCDKVVDDGRYKLVAHGGVLGAHVEYNPETGDWDEYRLSDEFYPNKDK